MTKILISGCLLGNEVRYDSKDSAIDDHPKLNAWIKAGRVVSICSEVAGGLPVPRTPAKRN